MKKSELKFRVFTGTAQRNQALSNALLDAGFSLKNGLSLEATVAEAREGVVFTSADSELMNDLGAEITLQQALDLIAQIEVEPKEEGEFVEFRVNDNGMYRPEWSTDKAYVYWSNTLAVEALSHMALVFAGWVWKDNTGRFVQTQRQGYTVDGELRANACIWVKPAQPVAVRFWRKT